MWSHRLASARCSFFQRRSLFFLLIYGLAGPAEEVDIQDWKETLKRAQDLQLKLRKRLNQRAARSAAPAMAEERGEESWAPLREKREALRQRIRTRDVASLAQIERELFEVEEQLVSKKISLLFSDLKNACAGSTYWAHVSQAKVETIQRKKKQAYG